ncbi:MAG TPA: hypothetical protein VFA20_31820 [Myxococcaceae bacterium]|nr:hypothetical protein [Myxococcaceae bacterium]
MLRYIHAQPSLGIDLLREKHSSSPAILAELLRLPLSEEQWLELLSALPASQVSLLEQAAVLNELSTRAPIPARADAAIARMVENLDAAQALPDNLLIAIIERIHLPDRLLLAWHGGTSKALAVAARRKAFASRSASPAQAEVAGAAIRELHAQGSDKLLAAVDAMPDPKRAAYMAVLVLMPAPEVDEQLVATLAVRIGPPGDFMAQHNAGGLDAREIKERLVASAHHGPRRPDDILQFEKLHDRVLLLVARHQPNAFRTWIVEEARAGRNSSVAWLLDLVANGGQGQGRLDNILHLLNQHRAANSPPELADRREIYWLPSLRPSLAMKLGWHTLARGSSVDAMCAALATSDSGLVLQALTPIAAHNRQWADMMFSHWARHLAGASDQAVLVASGMLEPSQASASALLPFIRDAQEPAIVDGLRTHPEAAQALQLCAEEGGSAAVRGHALAVLKSLHVDTRPPTIRDLVEKLGYGQADDLDLGDVRSDVERIIAEATPGDFVGEWHELAIELVVRTARKLGQESREKALSLAFALNPLPLGLFEEVLLDPRVVDSPERNASFLSRMEAHLGVIEEYLPQIAPELLLRWARSPKTPVGVRARALYAVSSRRDFDPASCDFSGSLALTLAFLEYAGQQQEQQAFELAVHRAIADVVDAAGRPATTPAETGILDRLLELLSRAAEVHPDFLRATLRHRLWQKLKKTSYAKGRLTEPLNSVSAWLEALAWLGDSKDHRESAVVSELRERLNPRELGSLYQPLALAATELQRTSGVAEASVRRALGMLRARVL